MSSLGRINDLVGTVYDCIPDGDLWQGALEQIKHEWSGCLATLGVIDTANYETRFSVSSGDPELLAPLVNRYGNELSFFSAIGKMEIDVPHTIESIYAIEGPGTREAWLSSAIVNEWVKPNALDDFFWVPVLRQSTRVGNLVVITDLKRHQISKEEMDRLSLLAPHVRRAVTIGDLFAAETRRAEIFAEILEALAIPVFVVADGMEVLFANAAGEELLRAETSGRAINGRLTLTWQPADAAVQRAVNKGKRDEFSLGSAGIGMPVTSGRLSAVAHVLPLARRDPSVRVSQDAAAAIFIAEAGVSPAPVMDAIAALFGLTAAEKRIATRVAQGHTRQEIAQASNVSAGTVKSQLSAIFDKTGTTDQRALENLIRELTPPIRAK